MILALFALATPLRVFHVNPITYAPAPINMDTGDALGDMYFDIRSVGIPIECAHPTEHSGHDCDNAEVVADDLVITQLVLDVAMPFGDYGRCNICINGTDHHGNNSCVDGVYWCSCEDYTTAAQCGPRVGAENLTEHMAHEGCKEGDPAWDCWRGASAKKTGGRWFSTTSAGYCGDGSSPPPAGCTWSVKEVVKRVNKTCSDDSIYSAVEAHAASGDCFQKCADSGTGSQRNTSSPCWISCFYTSALGPEAGKPGGAVAGMPLSDMLGAWNKPFLPESEGGCPAVGGELALSLPAPSPAKRWRGFPGFGR